VLILDGIASCLAVVASICTNATGTAEIQQSGTWSGAVLHVANATVTSTVASDSVVLPLTREMRRLCKNGKCLFYRGRCEEAADARKCILWYSFAANTPLRKIELTGDGPSVTKALNELKLVRSAQVLVPFSSLTYDAKTDLPPTCYARDGSC
jgi:hypothetical protein